VLDRVPDDWYVEFHRGLAARFWRAAAADMAEDDVRVVLPLLGDARSVLDVPCGDGRMTIRLAAAGLDAIGIDVAPEEVEHARAAGSPARFEVGDLKALPDVGRVDAVLSWGNSFGYLSPPDTARSLANLHRVLRPGGRLVLESLTIAESLLVRGVDDGAEYGYGGIRMTTTNRYNVAESRLETDAVFAAADGTVERSRFAHRVHTAGEVVRLVEAAGFGEVRLLAGDGATPYELGTPRMILVASRRR
jgi:SAM-dependent methyltransferase